MAHTQKRILFQISFVLVALLLIEIVLRLTGRQPGDLRPNWLQLTSVDSLRTDDLFFTNAEGLLVANKNRWAKENIYINADGFRNKEFEEIDTSKKKALLIGDSFVWGSSAQPMVGNCFADLIRNETNFEIINLGIQAVDPVQYAQIAKKYLPLLKPDGLLVFFYMGNDLMKQERNVPDGKPFVYVTNAGVIPAYDNDKYFSDAMTAYTYFVNEKYFLKHPDNIFEQVICKSALLSTLYSLRFRWHEKQEYENVVKNSSVTKKYLYSIQQMANEYEVPVKFVLIPELKEADMDSVKYFQRYADLLKDQKLAKDWLVIHPPKKFYRKNPDGHLNNEGHRFYADYLKAYLQQQLAE